MKLNKLIDVTMIISILAYIAVLIGDVFEVNLSKLIVFATTAIIFIVFTCTSVILEKLNKLEKK